MPRYFLEVSYKGTRYSGFQIQDTGTTIQGEIQRALAVFLKETIQLTGSSRTDSGVHALQNFFHFDWEGMFEQRWIYNLNAILPADIAVRSVKQVAAGAHCRFDAVSRSYEYCIYQFKNPFWTDTAFFYPYPLNMELLNEAAALISNYRDFSSFSKKNTQVKTFNCTLLESEWKREGNLIKYQVTANRFLRGMVRALVATMLRLGRNTITMDDFKHIIETGACGTAYFDAPAHGLTLTRVNYP
ncbi:tRNA pseudouridine(38,39,40) synthase TruA [Niabella ginsenosidivorans]|uniref:tRNA pseudouridine synthase A n=1 Tax=Niabella ginsenosidivorans TaxID=1176587 RepID=A0A1A9IAV2_9BACT|nr:tRNA pseudouridine(38-40) synthase TruA [Niabella ginsenosidivorans]ANH83694.1 tRNA pseudouridine(38,39,40) synthase TruA [Niabella ginsenosidivorans]